MISIDTNVIVRFLTQDDPVQFRKSRALFESHDIFITDTVILETEWVLRFAYNFDAESVANGLRMLFGLPNVQLSNPPLIAQVVEWHLDGMDFADALHLANSQQCDELYTFDKKLIKKAEGLTACDVLEP
uniref:PIN domain-containing protein n=1 Tax=uncultured Thiotrichaceae bacterium TaxID=298394 RepID=A0A6S6TW60_9GAMM|nr:MAG: Unknown protein [uncultured Thiotrichaceae bacterium]